MDYRPLTSEQIEAEAYTLQNYICLSTLQSELDDIKTALSDEPNSERLLDCKRVLEKAIELIN